MGHNPKKLKIFTHHWADQQERTLTQKHNFLMSVKWWVLHSTIPREGE